LVQRDLIQFSVDYDRLKRFKLAQNQLRGFHNNSNESTNLKPETWELKQKEVWAEPTSNNVHVE